MSKTSETQAIESYLAQIAHELRDLPSQAREEEMREIEAHLRALIEARGNVAEVLAQFGKPRRVGRDLRRAWERKQPEAWWCSIAALMFALNFCLFIAPPLFQEFYRFYMGMQGVNLSTYQPINADSTTNIAFENMHIVAQFFAFSLVLTATYIMGLISPKRSKFLIAGILVFLIWPNVMHEGLTTSIWTFIIAINLVVASFIGCYFGSRHGRRLYSRIASTR